MKKRVFVLVIITMIVISSCEKEFLEKPQGSDTTVDLIFSSKQESLSAIAQAYSMSLSPGITLVDWHDRRKYGMRNSTLSHISGEVNPVKFNWEDGWIIARSGMTADDGSGMPRSSDGFVFFYESIRHNYLVIENIDKVTDMMEEEKDQVKAEMKTLIAYQYEEMFKRYGGVPIVTSSLSSTDEIIFPRATLEETLNHIIQLCDEAAAILPDSHPRTFTGRVTKGVALAIKAEALMFAARPLFNSSTPYMSLGSNNDLISFGIQDENRWREAAEASRKVIEWSLANGYKIIDTGSPLDDYGTAVATPGNPEVLLSYKGPFSIHGNGHYYDPHGTSGFANSMSFNQLEQYVKADGTEQEWPEVGVERSYSQYVEKVEEMEPRYKASAMAAGLDAWNNPNSEYWSTATINNNPAWEGRGGSEGAGRRVKFWYNAGTRDWFEFPIYRLAEFYLNLAEAYNESGETEQSLQFLNVIRDRAGLPDIEETDQNNLRKKIHREWAVEFYEEGHRLFDVKHWMLDEIDEGIIGGEKLGLVFTYVNGVDGVVPRDYLTYSVKVVYEGFWNSSQYLEPFPVEEVNKDYIIQNPGY